MTPSKYQPLNSFQLLDEAIGVQLDRNFASLAQSISSVVDVLSVIARTDGKLANSTVHMQTLTDELYKYIQGKTNNWSLKGAWQQFRRYEYGDIVQYGASAYGCCVTHGASDNFNNDFTSKGYWQVLTGDNGNTPSIAYVDTQDSAMMASVLSTVSAIYETSLHAANTYATNQMVSNLYLSISSAANTYMTIAAAAQTFATINSLSTYAKLNSPNFTGIPTAPTPTTGDFSNKIATTEFVSKNFDAIGSMAVFTSSGVWTVPSGVTKAKVTVIGGGGGGGAYSFGCPTGNFGGIGGYGGSGFSIITNLSYGQQITCTVGAGGYTQPFTAPNYFAGGAGGSSSFGSYLTATGGGGGGGGYPTGGAAGANGVTSGALIDIGKNLYAVLGSGNPMLFYGQVSGLSDSSTNGANGMSGLIIIEW